MKALRRALPAAMLGLLVCAAPGLANVRYAAVGAPDDYSPAAGHCTSASPCSFISANSGASTPGDVLMLEGGAYSTSAVVTINPGVTAQSVPGDYAKLTFTGTAFLSLSYGVTIRNFEVDGANSTYLVTNNTGGPVAARNIDHMRIANTASAQALNMDSMSRVSDSVISSTGTGTVSAISGLAGDIRDSTILATSTNSMAARGIVRGCGGATGTQTLQVHNSISRAIGGIASSSGYSSYDLGGATCDLGGEVDYSYIGGTDISDSAGATHTTLGTANIATLPTLDSTAKQAPGSSSVDRGSFAYASAADTDVFGEPRISGLAPDIGADEYYVAPNPGGGGGTADITKPVISKLIAKKKLGKLKSFDFTSTEAGAATFIFTKKKGKRYRNAGSQTKAVEAGKNSIKPKKFKKGKYRLSLTVKDTAGNASAIAKLTFSVK